MTNEQGAKWLLQEMYDEGYRDIKIIGVYAYFVNPTFIENGGHFKVRKHTPRIPCRLLGIAGNNKTYSIASLLGIVEWEKVPVDTPIIIETINGFAKFEGGRVCYFCCGATSRSNGESDVLTEAEPRKVRLAENANN
ncbi:MAG: hypothetical protein E6387_00755 [Veillonella sp.]|nr:hypothetical protein [Veillonella sp.]